MRVDFNVPLEGRKIADDARIRAALPTLELLREWRARLVLCSHLGRPKGRDPETSLKPVSRHLGELLAGHVHQAPDVVGPEVRRGVERLEPGEILVLENTRWETGETKNDPALARELASLADAYVNDAFGAAHRAHASTAGVAEHLPSAAGVLLEREVRTLEGLVEDPDRPLVVVLGGAKVSDKIGLIDRFMDLADTILIGGAMCFSFFRAQGKPIGDSLVEEEGVELARRALERAEGDTRCRLLLPLDLVIADRFDERGGAPRARGGRRAGRMDGSRRRPRPRPTRTPARSSPAGTVFWNGPMGAFEMEPFAAGTRADGRGGGNDPRARRSSAAAIRPRRWRSSDWPTG